VTLTEFNTWMDRKHLISKPARCSHSPTTWKWSEVGLAQWIKENGIDLFVDHAPAASGDCSHNCGAIEAGLRHQRKLGDD